MVCEKCGKKLKEGETVCPKCGFDSKVKEEEKIPVTYEDDQVGFVDAPVIVEAHTFIDEESFAKKVQDMDSSLNEEEEDSSVKPFIWLFVFLLIVILVAISYFVVMPSITSNNQTKKNEVEEYSFSSEDWTVGEFMIDDEFYKMNQPFSYYFKKGWSFDSDSFDKGIEDLIDTDQGIDDVTLYNSFHEGATITVSLRNQRKQAAKIKNCYVWSVSVDNAKTEEGVSFTLPGQITNGSKELEIESIYGKVEEDHKIRDDTLEATTYQYIQNQKELDLIIYDNGGLKAFRYTFK